jgi:hypothetical protein
MTLLLPKLISNLILLTEISLRNLAACEFLGLVFGWDVPQYKEAFKITASPSERAKSKDSRKLSTVVMSMHA